MRSNNMLGPTPVEACQAPVASTSSRCTALPGPLHRRPHTSAHVRGRGRGHACRHQQRLAPTAQAVAGARGTQAREAWPPAHLVQQLNRQASADEEYDAIVIGSGVGGLTAAAQMVARGLKVLVLEKYLIPGGSASHFKRAGYTFDVGSSMMFGFGDKGTTNLLTRSLAAVDKKLETIPDPTQVRYHLPASPRFPQGLKLTVGRSREEFLERLVSLFPHEKEGIHKFYGILWDIFCCLNTLELKSLEEPKYLMEQFFKHPMACLGLVPHVTSNTGDVAARCIKDPELLGLIDAECFVFSTVPSSHTPIINAGMVLSDRFYGHINYPVGGVGQIPKTLAEGVVEHGGSVVYGAHVRHILTEDRGEGRREAVGVKLTDGREFRAKSLISNATRWDTFERMVGEEKMPHSETLFRTRYKRAPSFFSMHMGVDASIFDGQQDMDVHHIILDDWTKMQEPFGLLFVSMPSLIDSGVAPEGKHVIHAFTADWMDNWQGLSREAYAAKKQEKADALCQRLEEAILPGLCGVIELQEIGTPKTHRRFLGRNSGTYGPIPSRKPQGMVGMPFNRTSIKNLYCVGDSTFPGQGVNAVAMSGTGCAHRAMVDMGHLPGLPTPVDDAFTGTLQFFRDRA